MPEVRIIKRYANRKLYDTQHSRYVTLDQIADMIRAGDEVKIVDNKSKEDLTSITLAQIIFEEEKKQKSFLPLQAMRNIIQTGGESISHLVTTAQKKVSDVLGRKGKEDDDDELEDELPPEDEDDGGENGAPDRKQQGLSTLREFREWIESSQRTIDEWQKRVDSRVRHVVEGISPFTALQKDVKGLASRIAELEAKLEQLATGEHDADQQ